MCKHTHAHTWVWIVRADTKEAGKSPWRWLLKEDKNILAESREGAVMKEEDTDN